MPRFPLTHNQKRPRPVIEDSVDKSQPLYTPQFFMLLAALFAYMSGHNLLAHFSQFVVYLGGDIATIGWIAGLGMLGSLIGRPWMGPFLDRVGARRILIGAALCGSASFFAFQFVTNLWIVGLLRIMVQLALASFLMGIAVYSARIAPPGRSAESLATVGIGGLAGIMIGPAVGDVIFSGDTRMHWPYALYHNIAATLLLISCTLALLLPQPPPVIATTHQHQPFWKLIIRYWPGTILIVAFCLAAVQTVPMTFVERLAEVRNFVDIKWYFLVYSPTAILLRIVLVRLPRRIGRRRTLLVGMTSYTVGVLLLAGVKTQAQLVVPAAIMGVGHCFSYPFLLDLVGDAMPPQHRGVAVALVLAVMDIGFMVGGIVWGNLIEWWGFGPALVCVAAVTFTGTVTYALTQRPIATPAPDAA